MLERKAKQKKREKEEEEEIGTSLGHQGEKPE